VFGRGQFTHGCPGLWVRAVSEVEPDTLREPWLARKASTMIRLTDVSAAQGVVDWRGVKASGVSAVYIECTMGNEPGKDNPLFDLTVTAALAAGLIVGAYHFAYPLPTSDTRHFGRDPLDQAQRFHAKCNGVGGTGHLPPALDLEWPSPDVWAKWGVTGGSILDWGLAFLEECERLWGRTPVLYTYPWWWGSVGGYSRVAYARYPLWLADYANHSQNVPAQGEIPRRVPPWDRATLWQHTGGGMHLPGEIKADFSVFLGDDQAFQTLLFGDIAWSPGS
jgi:GH25 family lysozyme M1 (1,4-beta-N-acetylmuramidase)